MSNEYTVREGDTLWDIAKKHNVSLPELIKANPQIKNPDLISPRDKVIIPNTSLKTNKVGATTVYCKDIEAEIIELTFNSSIKVAYSKNLVNKPHWKNGLAVEDNHATYGLCSQRPAVYLFTKTVTVKKGDILWDIAKKHNVLLSILRTVLSENLLMG
jgi:spore coat assembly protein SafA